MILVLEEPLRARATELLGLILLDEQRRHAEEIRQRAQHHGNERGTRIGVRHAQEVESDHHERRERENVGHRQYDAHERRARDVAVEDLAPPRLDRLESMAHASAQITDLDLLGHVEVTGAALVTESHDTLLPAGQLCRTNCPELEFIRSRGRLTASGQQEALEHLETCALCRNVYQATTLDVRAPRAVVTV